MTDRINSFIVVLDHDVREDDAEDIKTALRMIGGVVSVEANVAGSRIDAYTAERRVRTQIVDRLLDMAAEINEGK